MKNMKLKNAPIEKTETKFDFKFEDKGEERQLRSLNWP